MDPISLVLGIITSAALLADAQEQRKKPRVSDLQRLITEMDEFSEVEELFRSIPDEGLRIAILEPPYHGGHNIPKHILQLSEKSRPDVFDKLSMLMGYEEADREFGEDPEYPANWYLQCLLSKGIDCYPERTQEQEGIEFRAACDVILDEAAREIMMEKWQATEPKARVIELDPKKRRKPKPDSEFGWLFMRRT